MILRVIAAGLLFVVLQVTSIFALLAYLVSIVRKDADNQWQMWIAADQLVNALIRGYADEAISARAWRRRGENTRWASARKMIDGLFRPWQQDHCYKSYLNEMQRTQIAKEYRE